MPSVPILNFAWSWPGLSWLVPAIHVLAKKEDVDARHKAGMTGASMWSESASVDPCLRLDVGDVVAQRIGVHRPIIDRDLAGHRIEPGERVLHPVDVVAVGK